MSVSKNIETVGVAPKVPVQAAVTVVIGLLAYYGIDLDAEVSGALGVIAGFVAGLVAPAAPVRPARKRARNAGYSIIEVLFALILLLILIWVLFALLPR